MNLYEPSDESIKYSIKSAKDFFLILFFVLNRYDYSLPRYRRLKRIAISRFLNRPLTLDIWPTSSLAAVRLATDKRWVTSFLVSYLRTYVVLEGKIGHDTYLEIRRLFPHSRRCFSLSYSRTIRDIVFKRENVLKGMMYTGILTESESNIWHNSCKNFYVKIEYCEIYRKYFKLWIVLILVVTEKFSMTAMLFVIRINAN